MVTADVSARFQSSRALQRIGDGERDLAALAVELGFSDHSHLTRTIRAATGHPPAACRALLSGIPEAAFLRAHSVK